MTGYDLLLKMVSRVVVDPATGCWNWTGAFSQSGWRGVFYPVIRTLTGGKSLLWRGNRLILVLYQGPTDYPQWPDEPWVAYLERLRTCYRGLEASHTCDNSRCLNPDHLGWRGHAVNIQEQVARRRARTRVEQEQEQEPEPAREPQEQIA